MEEFKKPLKDQLQDLIIDSINLTKKEKIERVNSFFNMNIEYSQDYIAYKASDYWATLSETLEKGYGDCDDFSLAKYSVLKILGVQGRLCVERVEGSVHMVCIGIDENNTEWVLDNQNPYVLERLARLELSNIEQIEEFDYNSGSVIWKNTWEDFKNRSKLA